MCNLLLLEGEQRGPLCLPLFSPPPFLVCRRHRQRVQMCVCAFEREGRVGARAREWQRAALGTQSPSLNRSEDPLAKRTVLRLVLSRDGRWQRRWRGRGQLWRWRRRRRWQRRWGRRRRRGCNRKADAVQIPGAALPQRGGGAGRRSDWTRAQSTSRAPPRAHNARHGVWADSACPSTRGVFSTGST